MNEYSNFSWITLEGARSSNCRSSPFFNMCEHSIVWFPFSFQDLLHLYGLIYIIHERSIVCSLSHLYGARLSHKIYICSFSAYTMARFSILVACIFSCLIIYFLCVQVWLINNFNRRTALTKKKPMTINLSEKIIELYQYYFKYTRKHRSNLYVVKS